VVQTQHGGEVLAWQIRRALHRNVGVGVGGVAHHQHAHVAAGHGVQGFALCGKDLGIDCEQFSAFHARAAGTRAHKQCHLNIFKRLTRVAVSRHRLQQRKRAIVKLHHDALKCFLRFFVRDLKQLQDDRLILAKHLA
jgi:hypothetical protein